MESLLRIFLFILAVKVSILFAYVTEKSKRANYNKMFEGIEKSVDNANASNKEILEAYKHESGNSLFIKNHRDGTDLEYYVFKCLYRIKGKTLTNLYLPKKKGLTQIDNLLIHPTGVYVIECKDWKAREIRGNERLNNWKCIYRNNRVKESYNPLKQNLSHSIALQNSVGAKNIDGLVSSIVILGSNNFDISYSPSKDGINQYVFSRSEFAKKLKDLFKDKPIVFSDEDILEIYKEIHYKYSNVKNTVKKKHLKYVQEIIARRESIETKRA